MKRCYSIFMRVQQIKSSFCGRSDSVYFLVRTLHSNKRSFNAFTKQDDNALMPIYDVAKMNAS